MQEFRIAVIPGDGIGKEVIPEGIRVLAAAGARSCARRSRAPVLRCAGAPGLARHVPRMRTEDARPRTCSRAMPRTSACQAFRQLARFRRALPTPPARRPSEARPEAHSACVMWGSRQRPEGLAGTAAERSAAGNEKHRVRYRRGIGQRPATRERDAPRVTDGRSEEGACWHARR